jgi:hypothetical protein
MLLLNLNNLDESVAGIVRSTRSSAIVVVHQPTVAG